MTGKAVSQYLNDKGIKQKWLAEKLDISESRLSGMLTGRYPMSAEMLFDICRILNVSSEVFRYRA